MYLAKIRPLCPQGSFPMIRFRRVSVMEFLVYQCLCPAVLTKTTDEQTELALSLVRLRIQWLFVSCKCAAHHVMPGSNGFIQCTVDRSLISQWIIISYLIKALLVA